MKELEKRIIEIEKRNKKVEQDKAWETSLLRRLLLILFTYLTIGIYMKFVLNTDPWLNAIIPSLGFYLSTLSLPFFKKIWDKYFYKKG
ncbi:hypothetical protein A2334_03465 [Candidatus Roizmanbacteria bacterium RIFOXYB2_FULL_38_10]|uniref:2TM domain-containing protein n=1 Tax=Candidatus Roizmanbacteria bacterium RIFOXYD1_FULL_38_12 TaxID=1802093 RepID=A0A1F7L2P5_9BACT|nr:MAG: hypothetical protein A3K47_03380 [Candidatus Roizmanbacteria bacterium RIFOXYA2_FULL_38_14]OGK64343.1 MAG: hypothetical protein A3K27_03380 [Candidatus Roizmanbacteria bacterium RIFOXYA1_FULL_37_12]OGK66189.1 MAG: hypothetical protein A3K38_03380 [Candidatus Roizmanbacteria bacterium RIFOXYB1_FULL_40_23]OGK67515.1 MAG: hypothetical protein A2334_03465 [Candidatus Roizmanbacteria bacterium RIFOXYB2_FULL_38_10]OGK70594.1 MAG: hypothetical protein A3K21_03385 [Candidatus Roizmanbacteria ba